MGVDRTDKEFKAAECGQAPPGDDELITWHESLGVVERLGKDREVIRLLKEDRDALKVFVMVGS